MDELTLHMLGVNEVASASSSAAKAAFVHEVYARAYALHVVISATPGWRLSGPAGVFSLDDESSVIANMRALPKMRRKQR